MLGFVLADGHLLFNLNLFDEYNHPILRIVNNWLAYSTSPWDIQLVGKRLIVRVAHRQILVDVQFEPPNKVRIERARLLRNGAEVLVFPESVLVAGKFTQFVGCGWENITVGISVGSRIEGALTAIDIPEVSRYQGDRTEAIRWAQQIQWPANPALEPTAPVES
jgi:trigger factor